MAGRTALIRFVEELRRLRRLAGSPSLNRLAGLTASSPRPLPRSTISDKLAAKSLPDWDFVASFVTACAAHAREAGKPLPTGAADPARWEAVYWRLLQTIDTSRADERLVAAARVELRRRTGGQSAVPQPAPAASGRRTLPVVPKQLPAPPRHFVGRFAELAALNAFLDSVGVEGAMGIATIDGTAGVGKTALAVGWAHRVVDRFVDGQLFVNLRGFDPSGRLVSATEAVRGFLDALQVPVSQVPADFPAQVALYRTLVAGKRMLVLLDNARDAEQVRALLPGSASCFVVVTSRARLTGLVARDGAWPLSLDVLAVDEARELLGLRLGGVARLAAEPEATRDIIASCGGLPLALLVIAARAVTRPEFPLGTLAAHLRAARNGLDAFATDGDPTTDVRSVISWSYRSLRGPVARLFRLLGLHLGPDVTAPAAASLAGVPVDEAHRLIAELFAVHLIGESTPGRFAMHDVIRTYATEVVCAEEPPAGRRAAVVRMLDHYLGSAYAADQLLGPYWTPIRLPPAAPGVVPESFNNDGDAFTWFADEHSVLLSAVRYTTAEGLDAYTWRLAWALTDFLDRHGDWCEWADTQGRALDAAQRLGDPVAQAHARRGLAGACARLGRFTEARTHLKRAIELFEALGDPVDLARTRLNLGWVCEEQGGHEEAVVHASHALDLLRAAGHRQGEASTLNALGWLHSQLGRHELALASCEQALALYKSLGDRHGEAGTWDSAGYAHHHLGRYVEAVACFQRALKLRREVGGRYYQADLLVHLGDSHEAMGDRPAARAAWQEALALLDDIGHPDAEKLRARIAAAS